MTQIFEQHSELMCLQVADRKTTNLPFKHVAVAFLVSELQLVRQAELPRQDTIIHLNLNWDDKQEITDTPDSTSSVTNNNLIMFKSQIDIS